MQQVVTFPKGRFDDGVDAGGMSKDELAKRWITKAISENPYAGVAEAFRNYTKNEEKRIVREGEAIFDLPVCKELEAIKRKEKQRRKGIFDS
jgi:hypothetical protein